MTVVVNMEANSGRVELALAKIASKFRGVQSEANQVSKTVDRIGSSRMKLDPTLAELKNVNATLARTQTNITKTFDGVSRSLRNAALALTAALSGAALAKGVLSASDSMTQLQNKIALVTGRTEELIVVQNELYKIAARTGGSVLGAAELFNKYGNSLKGAGKSTADILQMTELTQKAFAIVGGSADSANAAIMQLGQGLASGALRGEELNSVMEQASPLAAIFAKELGTNMGGIRKMAADGLVTAEVISNAFVNHGADIEEAFKTANLSIASSFGQVGDQMTRVVGTFLQLSGISAAVSKRVNGIAQSLSNIDSADMSGLAGNVKQINTMLGLTVGAIITLAPSVVGLVVSVMKRIADSMPYVTLPMLTAFQNLSDRISFEMASIYLGFFRFFRVTTGLEKAIANLFKSKTVLEFKDALDALSAEIEVTGRRWYNFGNNAAVAFYSAKQSLLEAGLYLGLLDQRLIRVNRSSNDTFMGMIAVLRRVGKAISTELGMMPALASFYYGILKVKSYLRLLATVAKNEMVRLKESFVSILPDSVLNATIKFTTVMKKMLNSVYQAASSVLPKVTQLFSTAIVKVERLFFWLYDQVVGNSWWPDLLDGVLSYATSVLPRVETVFYQFRDRIAKVFADLFGKTKTFDIKAKISLAQSGLETAKTSLKSLMSGLSKSVLLAWKAIETTAPILVDYISVAVAAGLMAIADPALLKTWKTFFKVSVLTGIASAILEVSGEDLIDSKVFGNIGAVLGQSLGASIRLVVANIPLITRGLMQAANEFGKALLNQLGFIGSFINGIGAITGTGGIINAILFGVGIQVVLGRFKAITSTFNFMMTALSGASFGGMGANKKGKVDGILGYMLLGEGRGLIAKLLGVYSVLTLIPNLINGEFSLISTELGLIGLFLLGPAGSAALLYGILQSITVRLATLVGMQKLLGAPIFTSVKDFGNAMQGAYPKIASLLTFTRGALVAISLELGMLQARMAGGISGLAPFVTSAIASVSSLYTAAALRMSAVTNLVGGVGGLFSKLLFGKTAKIIAILAAVVALMTGAASAAESGAAMIAGQSWGDLGMIGLLLLGSGLGGPVLALLKGIVKKAVGILGGLALSAMSSSIGIVARIGTAVAGAMTTTFTGIIAGIGAALATTIFGIPVAVIAAVTAIVAAIGGGIYYWLFSGETEAEKKMAEVKQKAAALRSELQKSLDPANVSKLLETSEITVNLKALLDANSLEGMSERQLKNVEVAMKAFDKVAERNNEILLSEGVLTRAQILEVRRATKAVEAAIKQAPNPAENPKAVSDLRGNLVSALAPYIRGMNSADNNAPVGNGRLEQYMATDSRNRKYFEDLRSGKVKAGNDDLVNSVNNPRAKVLANLLKVLDSGDIASADPAVAAKFFKNSGEYLLAMKHANNAWLGSTKEEAGNKLDRVMPTILDELGQKVIDSFTRAKKGKDYENEISNILADASELGIDLIEDNLRMMSDNARAQLVREMKSAKASGAIYELTTRDQDGPEGPGNIGGKTDAQAQTRADTIARLEELGRSFTSTVNDGIDQNMNALDRLNTRLQEIGATFQAEQFVSPSALAEAEELMRSIAEKRQMLLEPLEAKVANGIMASIAVDQNAIINLLGTTEQKLENVSSIVDGMPDVNSMLYLSNETINQIVAYGNKILEIMALIKAGGAGPGALNSPVGDSMADQAAATIAVTKGQILSLAGVPKVTSNNSSGKGNKGGGGGGADAKTWWEEFQAGLSAMNLKIDERTLANMTSGTLGSLLKASDRYKAAQDALNKAAAGEVEQRRAALKLMQEARQEALRALNDGTFGGVKSQLESLSSSLDEAIIGKLTQGQAAYASALALRIDQLTTEREAMAIGSDAAISATNEIGSLTMKLEELANSSQIMRQAFEEGLSSFLKGQTSLNDFLTGLLDTFTSTIIDKFSKGFTDSIFNSLGLDQLFTTMFGGATEMGSTLGNVGGKLIGGELGSSMGNAMWVQTVGGGPLGALAGNNPAGATGAATGGGGFMSMFTDMFKGIGNFFQGIFSGIMSLFGGGFASGGRISGPGSGTSDSILAGVSNGEYIVNAASTKTFLPLLETINRNHGRIPKFATGGRVGPSNPSSFKTAVSTNRTGSSTSTFNLQITGDVSQQTRKEIVKMMPQIASGVNGANKERGAR